MSRRIGAVFVLVPACVFGATTPLVKHFFSDLDPVMLAGFLNFGSGLAVVGASLAWAIDTNLMSRVAAANTAPMSRAVKQPVVFPAILDGRIVGEIQAPAGTQVNVVSVQAPSNQREQTIKRSGKVFIGLA